MATTYKSSITVDCWKQHTCVRCESLFRYRLQRKVQGSGSTEAAASANARKAAEAAVLTFDVHPCPHCGLVQPEMIGQERASTHNLCGWIALITLPVLLIVGLAHGITMPTLAITSAILVIALAAWQVTKLSNNPNANLDANRQRAQASISKYKLKLDSAGSGARDAAFGCIQAPHKMALAILGIAALACASPELYRMAMGWPLNDDFYQPVVGPGDSACYYTGRSVSSVHGYWRGESAVTLANAAELGLPPSTPTAVVSHSKTSSWGNSISAKSSEKSSSDSIWVEMTLPKDDALAGKDAKLNVEVNVVYPQIQGSSTFVEQMMLVSSSPVVKLASPGAGASYYSTYLYGSIIGALLAVFACFRLKSVARALNKLGNGTVIMSPEEAEAAEAPKQ